MANDKVKVTTSKLTALADAIRAKSGGSEEITLNDIPSITIEIVNELTHLTFTLPPKEYTAGDALDLTGMSVIAHYSHLGDKDVTSVATISPAGGSPLVTGNNTITASYTEKGVTKTASVVVNAKAAVAAWNDGSWAEIADALNKHKNGEVNLYQTPGWEIGASRYITVGNMGAGTEIILIDHGAIPRRNASGYCLFVWAFSKAFSYGGMSTANGKYDWNTSRAKTYFDNTLWGQLPADFRNLIPEVNLNTYDADGNIKTYGARLFAPAAIEVMPSNNVYQDEGIGRQFKYYENSGNRSKGGEGSMNGWWTRSVAMYYNNATQFFKYKQGTLKGEDAYTTQGSFVAHGTLG